MLLSSTDKKKAAKSPQGHEITAEILSCLYHNTDAFHRNGNERAKYVYQRDTPWHPAHRKACKCRTHTGLPITLQYSCVYAVALNIMPFASKAQKHNFRPQWCLFPSTVSESVPPDTQQALDHAKGKPRLPRGGLPLPPAHKMALPGPGRGAGRYGTAGFLPSPLSEGLSGRAAAVLLSSRTGGTSGCHSSSPAPPGGRRGRVWVRRKRGREAGSTAVAAP